jgi:hypothetical protein
VTTVVTAPVTPAHDTPSRRGPSGAFVVLVATVVVAVPLLVALAALH